MGDDEYENTPLKTDFCTPRGKGVSSSTLSSEMQIIPTESYKTDVANMLLETEDGEDIVSGKETFTDTEQVYAKDFS